MTRFDDDDNKLLELRDCDAHDGFSVSGLGSYYERKCPKCGFPRLREVFTSNGKERGRRERIQAAQTRSVGEAGCEMDAYGQMGRVRVSCGS